MWGLKARVCVWGVGWRKMERNHSIMALKGGEGEGAWGREAFPFISM